MGGIITVAPGIKWLRMPLPFRLDHINLYLLEDGDGWTVVDAGIGLDRTRELWQGVLDAELDGKPITRVFVTHFHPDHMGNAHWLTERCEVDLWCSQAEWLMAQLAWRAGDIDERLAEALDAIAEPHTAFDLVRVLFRRKLDTHQLGFAIGEALAHLHYLEAEGLAARLVGGDGIHRFQKA